MSVASIIVQGGSGAFEPGEAHEKGLTLALEIASETLERGGSVADAAEAAVVLLEDDPTFNAGYGSYLNLVGEVETDASIMLSDLSCGAVGALTAVANPIKAARLVMERTDHLLLVGRGADEFARKMGLPGRDLRSPQKIELHARGLEKLRAGEAPRYFPSLPEIWRELELGTVGAVVVDDDGLIAAATSTGGISMKLPGRIGDSAIIGAGTYANASGGVSATGHGELIMRHLVAKTAADAIAEVGVREAIETVVELGRVHGILFGIVGADESGAVAHGFTTEAMCWASLVRGELSTFQRRP